MPELKKRITEDLKSAQKAKSTLKISVLRMVLSEIQNQEIAKRGELSEKEVIEILLAQAKRRAESAEQFAQAGREDLTEQEKEELVLLRAYLPEQLSDDEARAEARTAIKETGAQGPQDMGRVMGRLMPKLKGRIDGAKLSSIVKQELTKYGT